MEFVGTKRGRKRKRNRRSIINNKQRQIPIKFEVRARKDKLPRERSIQKRKEKLIEVTMDASTFWENTKAAEEWQNRHKLMWWKTRCFALEHENYVLKETLKNLVQNQNVSHNIEDSQPSCTEHEDELCDEESETNDNLEFQVDEDMMSFLAQSMKHKIELKNQRESEKVEEKGFEMNENTVNKGVGWIQKRSEDGKLLYGEASSKVLAMETALQVTAERHIDKVKPQYWPNIPLKL